MLVYLKPERILVRFLHIDSKDSYTKKAQRSRTLEPRSEMQGVPPFQEELDDQELPPVEEADQNTEQINSDLD